MTFFIYRSCDITGTGARRTIQRNQDILNRGIALITEPSGVPTDDTPGSDNPDLPIISAEWADPIAGAGELPPGTYDYKIIPVNTCTGRTGPAQTLPPLTISALGEVAMLRMKLSSKTRDCNSAIIQRNGVVVGAAFPTSNNVLDNVPIITAPNLIGNFVNGTASTFDRTTGADLQFGDLVSYQGKAVKVVGVVGPTVTFEPPIEAVPPPAPAGFFDMGQRTGIYFSDLVSIPFPVVLFASLLGLPFPMPWMAFKMLSVPGLLATPQVGDLILYGSKTAIVVVVEPDIAIPPTIKVGVIPFGLLPIPPLPAGLFQLIARPLAGFVPSVGLYFNLDSPAYGAPGTSAYDKFEVLGNGVDGAPVDPNITLGSYLGVNGQFVQITNVENGTDISGAGDLTKARVTVSPNWSTDVQVKFPAPTPGFPAPTPGTAVNQPGIIGGYGLPTGPYVALPASLAGMFLTTPSITPTGSYTRLSRVISITQDDNILQFQETGKDQERSGTVDGTGAKVAIDQLFSQNNYPGGLPGLIDKVRGPRATTPSSVFVKTNGALTQIGQKLKAVNKLATKGTGTTISLTKLREMRESLCGSWANVETMNAMLQDQGFAAARFEAREIFVDPAKCPPGQPNAREVQLFCVGLATPQVKVKDGEQIRFFWAEGRRAIPGNKKKLMALGLTADEADSATQLETSGRLLSVVEVTTAEGADIIDFTAIDSSATDDLDDVLDDTRIVDINTGPITRDIIKAILDARGSKGIVKRPPGTDPTSVEEEGYRPIDDFSLPVHNLAALTFQLQLSFDVCDFEAALASLPPGQLRDNLAALFAIIEASLSGLVRAGRAITTFLTEGPFADAVDALTSLVMALATDPTLSCLIGPFGSAPLSGLNGIPQIDVLLQGFAFPFQTRFDLSQLLGEAIASVLCTLIGALVKVIGNYGGADTAAFAQRAIGCVATLDIPGLEFPSLDVQIALECGLDQLQLLLDIIQELIAEANEVVNFINDIGSGFMARAVEARNNACSSGADLQSLVGGLSVLGVGGAL